MSDRFRYYVRVRYGECDAQKVVFNARYADYVDLSTTEFLRALGFGEALINGTFDYQLVKLTIEMESSGPLRPGARTDLLRQTLGQHLSHRRH